MLRFRPLRLDLLFSVNLDHVTRVARLDPSLRVPRAACCRLLRSSEDITVKWCVWGGEVRSANSTALIVGDNSRNELCIVGVYGIASCRV